MFKTFETYIRSKIPVTDEQMKAIGAFFRPRSVSKGRMILQVNEICDHTCFVVRGCLRSYVIDDKGREHILQFAPENWWISEQISLLNGEPSMYFIDAVEDTDYLAISREFFAELPRIVPSASNIMNTLQLYNLRALQKRLISHLSATGEERYLAFLKTHPSLALRLPQKMIASYLGVTPESLSRIRKELASQ